MCASLQPRAFRLLLGLCFILLAHLDLQRFHRREAPRVYAIALDIGFPRYGDIAVTKNGLNDDIGYTSLASCGSDCSDRCSDFRTGTSSSSCHRTLPAGCSCILVRNMSVHLL